MNIRFVDGTTITAAVSNYPSAWDDRVYCADCKTAFDVKRTTKQLGQKVKSACPKCKTLWTKQVTWPPSRYPAYPWVSLFGLELKSQPLNAIDVRDLLKVLDKHHLTAEFVAAFGRNLGTYVWPQDVEPVFSRLLTYQRQFAEVGND